MHSIVLLNGDFTHAVESIFTDLLVWRLASDEDFIPHLLNYSHVVRRVWNTIQQRLDREFGGLNLLWRGRNVVDQGQDNVILERLTKILSLELLAYVAQGGERRHSNIQMITRRIVAQIWNQIIPLLSWNFNTCNGG